MIQKNMTLEHFFKQHEQFESSQKNIWNLLVHDEQRISSLD